MLVTRPSETVLVNQQSMAASFLVSTEVTAIFSSHVIIWVHTLDRAADFSVPLTHLKFYHPAHDT